MRLFTNSLSGTFVSRPNRFVVEVETSKGLVRAHCPNPGRLTEILVPGRSLILERSETACRALPYTLAAARYRGKIIPLVSVKANVVAERFVVPRLYPEGSVIRREAVHGGSRFDFMVTDGTTSGYVEVKSCTLCEYGRGMFPDAPTTRGERHVRELAGLSVSGLRGDALFMVSHPDVSVFSPNIHTDPEFSRTLLCVRETVGLHAWKYSVDEEGAVEGAEEIPVDLSPAELVERNGGFYLLVLAFPERRLISTGALGAVEYSAGFYVYVGSAARNLTQRTARHLRKRKKVHWHIDYISAEAPKIAAFPIFSAYDHECELAAEVEKIAEVCIPHFGAGDCGCNSHLFYFNSDPLSDQRFLDLLFYYRHAGFLQP